jgi:hypothetical protein
MTISTAPVTAQQVSTMTGVLQPAPSKNAVDRSGVALAPEATAVRTHPTRAGAVPALFRPDNGLPSSSASSAPVVGVQRWRFGGHGGACFFIRR